MIGYARRFMLNKLPCLLNSMLPIAFIPISGHFFDVFLFFSRIFVLYDCICCCSCLLLLLLLFRLICRVQFFPRRQYCSNCTEILLSVFFLFHSFIRVFFHFAKCLLQCDRWMRAIRFIHSVVQLYGSYLYFIFLLVCSTFVCFCSIVSIVMA